MKCDMNHPNERNCDVASACIPKLKDVTQDFVKVSLRFAFTLENQIAGKPNLKSSEPGKLLEPQTDLKSTMYNVAHKGYLFQTIESIGLPTKRILVKSQVT